MSNQDHSFIAAEVKKAVQDIADKIDKNTNILVNNQKIIAQAIDKN